MIVCYLFTEVIAKNKPAWFLFECISLALVLRFLCFVFVYLRRARRDFWQMHYRAGAPDCVKAESLVSVSCSSYYPLNRALPIPLCVWTVAPSFLVPSCHFQCAVNNPTATLCTILPTPHSLFLGSFLSDRILIPSQNEWTSVFSVHVLYIISMTFVVVWPAEQYCGRVQCSNVELSVEVFRKRIFFPPPPEPQCTP